MRIMLVSSLYPPDQVGGAEVLVAQLAGDLIAAGDEVAVACLSRTPFGLEQQNGVTVYRLGHGPLFYPLDWGGQTVVERAAYKVTTQLGIDTLPALGRALADFAPDVVNTHSLSELSPRVWSVARSMGVPVVHTLHDFTGLCTNGALFHNGQVCTQGLKCRAWGALHRLESCHVNGIIGVGADILDRHLVAGHFSKVEPVNRAVIWNPVEAAPPSDRMTDAPLTFGYLGRIEPSKGVDLLIEACRLLPPGGWRLEIAGRMTGYEQAYHNAVQDLPVDLVGFVDRDVFFNRIDCLVAPPLWPEAFGRTVAEAYLRGVPVIGSDIAGIGEQIRAVAPQWLFAAGDATSLAQRMMEFLGAPISAKPSAAAIAAFADRVSPTKIAAQYRALYESVALHRR